MLKHKIFCQSMAMILPQKNPKNIIAINVTFTRAIKKILTNIMRP